MWTLEYVEYIRSSWSTDNQHTVGKPMVDKDGGTLFEVENKSCV